MKKLQRMSDDEFRQLRDAVRAEYARRNGEPTVEAKDGTRVPRSEATRLLADT